MNKNKKPKLSHDEFLDRKITLVGYLNGGQPARTWKWQTEKISCVEITRIETNGSNYLSDWTLNWTEIHDGKTSQYHHNERMQPFLNRMAEENAKLHWTIGA